MSDRSSHDPAYAPETEQFDREINIRSVVMSGGILVAVTVVSCLLVLWMLKGFRHYDEKRDVRLSPIEAANPQQTPPGPLLQKDVVGDMREMREREDQELNQPAWVNQQQGLVRLPLKDAIEAIVARGVAPEAVGGKTGAPMTTDAAGTTATTPGGTRVP